MNDAFLLRYVEKLANWQTAEPLKEMRKRLAALCSGAHISLNWLIVY